MINLNKKKGEIGQKKRGGSLSDTDDPFLFLFRKKSKQNQPENRGIPLHLLG